MPALLRIFIIFDILLSKKQKVKKINKIFNIKTGLIYYCQVKFSLRDCFFFCCSWHIATFYFIIINFLKIIMTNSFSLILNNIFDSEIFFFKFDLPMNKKNISKPSSRIEALSVRPKICKPFECLDNLNIRNTRTNRITRKIAKDIA